MKFFHSIINKSRIVFCTSIQRVPSVALLGLHFKFIENSAIWTITPHIDVCLPQMYQMPLGSCSFHTTWLRSYYFIVALNFDVHLSLYNFLIELTLFWSILQLLQPIQGAWSILNWSLRLLSHSLLTFNAHTP